MAGAAPHRGRRKDTQGRLCGRGGSGAGRSEAGQRHAAEEPGATAGHPAEPRSYLRQLPGVLPPHAVPPVRGRLAGHELRAAGGLERAARRLQGLQHEVAHLKEHAPLPGHQPHVPGLHKRAAPAARELRKARRALAGGVPEEAALQVHLALHVLALGAHLDGALQLALKLRAGGPRKGLLEDDHVVDDALLHLLRPERRLRDGGRPLPVAGGSPARSSSTKRVPPYPWYLRASLCGSAEAVLGMQRRVLQGPGVGVLAGLHKIVQVEVACEERCGLAVRLVQQRLVPL